MLLVSTLTESSFVSKIAATKVNMKNDKWRSNALIGPFNCKTLLIHNLNVRAK